MLDSHLSWRNINQTIRNGNDLQLTPKIARNVNTAHDCVCLGMLCASIPFMRCTEQFFFLVRKQNYYVVAKGQKNSWAILARLQRPS